MLVRVQSTRVGVRRRAGRNLAAGVSVIVLLGTGAGCSEDASGLADAGAAQPSGAPETATKTEETAPDAAETAPPLSGPPREQVITIAEGCSDLQTPTGRCRFWEPTEGDLEGMGELRSQVQGLCDEIEAQAPAAAELTAAEVALNNAADPVTADMSCFAYGTEGTSSFGVTVVLGSAPLQETCEVAARDVDSCVVNVDGSLRLETPVDVYGSAQLGLYYANGKTGADLNAEDAGGAEAAIQAANSTCAAIVELFALA